MTLPSSLLRFTAAAAASLALSASAADPTHVPDGYKLLYEQAFNAPSALADFAVSDPKAWAFAKDSDGGALDLARQSDYKPAVRSPVNIALIQGKVFSDFILEADFKQTGREYGHRDMCVYFGFQQPDSFYYVHVATKADPNAHNVFIVNKAPRTNIAKKTTEGADWGLDVWRKVRLERNSKTGTVRVFFEDMTTPIMEAEDKTFASGYIGFGSFDDTGRIDNIKIWGPSAEEKPAAFFKPLE